jgi:Domain of unknown function (DUF4838)
MKKIKLLVALFCLITFAAKAQSLTIYYTPVKKPVYTWAEYYNYFDPETLATDMAELLQQATGKKTVAAQYDGKATTGIFLLLDSIGKYSSNEAALINCNGSNSLRITARYGTGLSYGLYTYLDKLGFKFYLPGAEWEIIPKLSSVYLSPISNKEWKPWFKHRFCGMSGGMPAVKNADDNRQNAVAWYKWYRRNRMGSEYLGVGGHIGEAFNIEHQKEIEQDPTLMAPEDGVNRKYSISAKLDPMSAKGVNMFTNWIVKQYKLNGNLMPSYMPWSGLQTVDPGDGLGYCHTPECEKKFKTVSDQVFYMANIAAKKMKSVYPNSGVSLYAYTERTDTPSIKLEPNVHVEIVATAFHNVATPAALIKRWTKKTTNLSIYDYLNIGVWNKEEPFFNLNRYFKYLNHIKSLKIDGFTFEAGPSKFSAGIIQYFILKYLNEPYADVQKEFDTFCRNCFGAAAAPINKMMQEWYFSDCKIATTYDQVTFHEDELGRFFGYLEQANNNANNSAVQQRLGELKAYTVYLTKHYEFWNDMKLMKQMQKSPALRRERAEDMLAYTWKLYNTKIFHNTQLNDVIKGYFPTDAALQQKWDYNNSTAISNLIKQGGGTGVDDYKQALKTYLPGATANYIITDSFLQKAALLTPDSIKLRMIDEDAFAYLRYSIEIYCPAPGKFTVLYNADKSKRPNDKMPSSGFVSVLGDDYNFAVENYIQPQKQKGTLTFNLPKKGHYQLTLAQNNSTGIAFTVLPGKNLLYINKKTIPMNGTLLLDQPDNIFKANKYLAIYAPAVDSVYYNLIGYDCVNYVQLYNSAGKALQQNITQSPVHISAKLSAADKNNFLFMSNGVYRWTPVLKNVPPYYFFLKFPAK